MNTITRIPVAAAALGLGLLAGTAFAETWDMPTPYPDGALTTGIVRDFAAAVKASTGGKIDITVHSNGSLVRHPEIKRAVQTQQVQLGELLISSLSNDDPVFGVDAIPFLASSYDAAKKLDSLSRPYIDQRFAKVRLKVLFTIPWPPQGLYTKKEVDSLADLKGIKFRTYNPATSRLADLAGTIPTKIEVAELAQAFGTGLVDAMLTSSATGVDTKSWEFISHFYDVQAWLPRSVIVVNAEVFKALPEDQQKALTDAAAALETKGWATSRQRNEEFKKILADHGVSLHQPSQTLGDELAKIGAIMTAEWIKTAGADGQAIVEAFHR
ncbi:MAG: C4-dicarboxylate ABC transporter substrate-binding protein [Azospirillum sp.]|nr:C4-dicarboxylate ABC transporter substrate-binding protein [Azospirillum sp.]